ncbi:hypothetical protein [Streptomyces sp. NPDC001381]|uniref:hypothetical protein n=1 Tax=Streptomyces sp. NPDC001381 TaxID=3364567 RepID=UPI00368D0043
MDEGIAALIAGAAAAVGGVVGAFGGGLMSARGSERAAETAATAALRQVQDQGAVEHAHWVRQQRQTLYARVVELYVAAGVDLVAAAKQLKQVTPLSESDKQDIRAAVVALEAAISQLALWGPQSVQDIGGELRTRIKSVAGTLFSWSDAVAWEPDQAHLLTASQEEARRQELDGWRTEYRSDLRTAAETYNEFVRIAGQTLQSATAPAPRADTSAC